MLLFVLVLALLVSQTQGQTPACRLSWVRNDGRECICDNGSTCTSTQFCYDSVCNDDKKVHTKSIVVKPSRMPKMCSTKNASCTVNPDTGKICCANFDGYTKSYVNGFTLPCMTNPSGDKYVSLACQKDNVRMCALTESGKIRCWNNDHTKSWYNSAPTYDDGDVAAKKGKFVFLDYNHYGGDVLMALRDDGVIENFDHSRPNNVPTKTAPTGRTYVGMDQGAFLLDDGTVEAPSARQIFLDDDGVGDNVDALVNTGYQVCVLRDEDKAWVCSPTYPRQNCHVYPPPAGTTYVKDGSDSTHQSNISFILSDGSVTCYDSRHPPLLKYRTTWKYCPHIWKPSDPEKTDTPSATAKYIECTGGLEHFCCARDDGVIDCLGKGGKFARTVNTLEYPLATPPIPACPVSLNSPLTAECMCETATTPCTVGQWCYDGGCKTAPKCTPRANNQKNIFYGAKVYGAWNASTKVMSMNFSTPFDVRLNSIVWKNAASQQLKFSSTDMGFWKKDMSDGCKPTYRLDVPQTTFFGDGSKFKIKGSQLSTNLRVEASESVTTVKNGETYTYARTIKNTVPVLVNLVTKTTIKVRFRSTVAPPGKGKPKMEDFVLFIAAEDNFADAEKNVIITMEVHSRACVDHTLADKGVRVVSGLDNIADGKASEFVWATDATGKKKQKFEHDLCVEELQWTFYPKKYKENTYEIDLQFTSRGTAETFTTTAAIDIKQADVLADIGFTSSIVPFEDEACTVQSSKFKLGQKFYTKITLTDLVVPTTNITCGTYKIKQTKDGNTETTDLKEEAKYNFVEVKVPGTNTHICGAELESHHFHISVDGYDTTLETEIVIEYDQNYRRRKLINIPITRDMMLAAAGYGYDMEDEYAVGVVLSDEDLTYQNTKREPDTDDMAIELYVEPEENSVAIVITEETLFTLKKLTMMFFVLSIAGFTYGYFSNKYKNNGGAYLSLVEMEQ